MGGKGSGRLPASYVNDVGRVCLGPCGEFLAWSWFDLHSHRNAAGARGYRPRCRMCEKRRDVGEAKRKLLT